LAEDEDDDPGSRWDFDNLLGTVVVESAELIWKGVAYRTDLDFLRGCCDARNLTVDSFDSDLVMNEVLRAGERIPFLQLKQSADPAVFATLQRAMISRDLQLVVCYCSIFDECWKSDVTTLSLTPAPVKSCERPKIPFDQNFDRRL